MAERNLPVASIQVFAHDAVEFERRWPRIAGLVEQAAAAGAKLIVAPEGTVPGYVIGTDPVEPALLSSVAEHIGLVAAKYGATIVYGSAHVENGTVFNTGTVVGPSGEVLGRAEKQLLWHFDERWFARGRSLGVIDTPAGRLGVLICADGRLPTLARTLVERGAEMLVMPTAWVTSGRDPGNLENVQADFMAQVRARENGVPLIAANKVGVEAHAVAYCGKSAIIDGWGTVMAQAGQYDETTLHAQLRVGAGPALSSRSLIERAVPPPAPRERLRLAISADSDTAALDALTRIAQFSDVDVVIAPCSLKGPLPVWDCSAADDAVDVRDDLAFARVSTEAMLDPTALVAPRLRGVDLFVWTPAAPFEERWQIAFARTRAAELRAYVVVVDRVLTHRAFAVDPDGTVVCGTFGDLRLAQFAYDRARSGATTVVPRTDVLAGLRAVERLRAPA